MHGCTDAAAAPTVQHGRQHPFAPGRLCSTLEHELSKSRPRKPMPHAGDGDPRPRRGRRQLGAPEYTLLGLIALGITVTLVLAILNPPG
jgi:hypothetical protein